MTLTSLKFKEKFTEPGKDIDLFGSVFIGETKYFVEFPSTFQAIDAVTIDWELILEESSWGLSNLSLRIPEQTFESPLLLIREDGSEDPIEIDGIVKLNDIVCEVNHHEESEGLLLGFMDLNIVDFVLQENVKKTISIDVFGTGTFFSKTFK